MIKIHIPNILRKDDLQCFTEIFLIIPFINLPLYNEIQQKANWWNEGLFTKLFFNGPVLENVELSECDIVGIPFKYSPTDERITNICNDAYKYNKKVVAFYNDDFTDSFDLPTNLILFRTSALKSQLKVNERILPVFVPDHSSINNILNTTNIKRSVGFCGHSEGIRSRILNKINNIIGSDNCNFIIRSTFYHNTGQVNINTRREYCANIADNLYTLCIRGAGNFSYRFYEALCMGRIPILINTETALPLEKIIDWSKYIIKINESELEQLPTLISECKINPVDVRRLWEEYFSPEGYTKNFYKDL
jgi:hypothetical protein